MADDGSNLVLGSAAALNRFCRDALIALGVPEADAAVAATIVMESDLRGIESHGLPRFEAFYVNGIKEGRIKPRPNIQVVSEAPAVALIEGDHGLGMVVGHRAMSLAIEKARATGAGFVTVRNSRHFGIAGYYATMAMEQQMIGLSMTNASPLMPPTYGSEARLGTNPIALAAPAADGQNFVLDMATTTVAAGKFEVALRKGARVPKGWGGDDQGVPTDDPKLARYGRHYSPLGGTPEMASHKGYGLSSMVEVLCGVLSGSEPAPIQKNWSNIGHFFGALNIASFRPVADFEAMMADMNRSLRETPRVEGADRVYVPGDKEREAKARHLARGIPLYPEVLESLRRVGRDLGVPLDL
ncbi:MAG: Ldh family oxidoreductase [Dehalococcoidia bacterium]|nr:Ldh family oxidoreductase [Dehalococcoidia bacterium]